ncbi:SRPBCC family protein [Rarobacter faecitabidus]|nr:SRPBCC family protein [Rarobacter faecitabidus]
MGKATRAFRNLTLLTIGAAATAAVLGAVRSWSLRWGTDPLEEGGYLPGDELMAYADHQSTRAVTIRTSPARIWPWLVQLGQDRGGFYSYDWLENLIGLDIHSLDEISDELQHLEVGDHVSLADGVTLAVADLESDSHLVLHGVADSGRPALPFDFTWSFILRRSAPARTRLIVRERYRYLGPLAPVIVEPASLVSFVMSRKMLIGIKERAEALD